MSPAPADDTLYIPLDMHAVQPVPSMNHDSWVPSSILYPTDLPTLFPHSPSPPFVPEVHNSTTLRPSLVHSRPSTSTNPPDYVWVPQRQYVLTAHHFAPAPPITFNVDSGEPGIRLSAALNRKFSHLKERDDLVFESNKSPTITMRLEVRTCFSIDLDPF
jgi:hypothetical protein